MKLSFLETMRGEVTGPGGVPHAVAFHVRATQVAGGRFALDGVVHAGPFGDEARCEGTLDLSVAPPRLAYDVRWAAGGHAWALVGAKTPRLWAPVASMTLLPITLTRDGAALAQGTMAFDLFELPGFVASWLPLPQRARRRFEARLAAVTRRALVGVTP